MLYDIVKIVKKCIKYWFIFLITLVIGSGAIVFDYLKADQYSKMETSMLVTYLNSDKILQMENENSTDYFNNQIFDIVSKYYLKENKRTIAEQFKLSESDFDIEIYRANVSKLLVFDVKIYAPSDDVVKNMWSYVSVDLQNYIRECSQQIISESYLTDVSFVEVGGFEFEYIKETNSAKIILLVLGLLIIEIIVVAMITIKNYTFLCNDEIEDNLRNEFDEKIFLKDYDKNLESFNYRLDKIDDLKMTTLLISEKNEIVTEIKTKYNLEHIDISDLDLIDKVKNNKKIKNVILEIIKNKTKILDIGSLIKNIKSLGIEKIYIITRDKEKK